MSDGVLNIIAEHARYGWTTRLSSTIWKLNQDHKIELRDYGLLVDCWLSLHM